jgi:uncharacterized protein YkwD
MWRVLAAACAAAFLVTSAAASTAAAAPCRGADSAPSSLRPHQRAAVMVCLFNRERAARGLSPLRPSRRLARAARRHSADMVRHHYFAHPSSSGASVVSRIARTGFLRRRGAWHVGEVLAWGSGAYATPASRMAELMNSPRHRRIILGSFRYVGAGVALGVPFSSAPGATYTADFGK